MKTIGYKPVLFILILLAVCSCKSKPSSAVVQKAAPRQIADIDSIHIDDPNDFDEPGIPVGYTGGEIDTLYVTDRNGVEVKNHPDINSSGIVNRSLDEHGVPENKLKLYYGDRLIVLEKVNGWLGVRESITRRTKENGQMWLSAGWEKVYVQEKSAGRLADIKVIPEQLSVIVADGQDVNNMPKQKTYLKGYLDLKLVSKAAFDSAKTTAVDYLIKDTAEIKKKNGVIELPYQNGIKHIKDFKGGEDDDEYNYVGQIPFLNAYVISGEYGESESGDYSLYDKKTGKVLATTTVFPHISEDKRYIIGINNTDDNTAYLELYKISEGGIKEITEVTFYYWAPTQDDKAMFWGSDGCFYVPVSYSALSVQSNNYFQYLQIRVL